MSHDDFKTKQTDILEKALAILKDNHNVLGVLTTGSFARGDQDAFSDIDVGCIMKDEERTGREELYNAVAEIAPRLCKLYLYDVHALYLFENGIRLDLDFDKPSVIPKVDRNKAKILYDPEGILERDLGKEAKPWSAKHPQWNENEGEYLDWYFWMFRQAYCWAKRGAQGGYKDFDKLYGAYTSINQIRQGLLDMRLWTLGEQNYLRLADQDFTKAIEQTFPKLNPDELLQVTKKLISIFENILPEYCKKANKPFPKDKIEIIKKLLNEYELLK